MISVIQNAIGAFKHFICSALKHFFSDCREHYHHPSESKKKNGKHFLETKHPLPSWRTYSIIGFSRVLCSIGNIHACCNGQNIRGKPYLNRACLCIQSIYSDF